jgi:PAS domain S-box-containing protein
VHLPLGPAGALVASYWNYEYVPLFDADGAVEGVMICGFDVTELVTARRAAEALATTLRVTGERLEAAQRVAGVGLFEWDAERELVHWSAELCALIGLDPVAREVTADVWTKAIVEEDQGHVAAAYNAAREARQDTVETEARLRLPDGESRWIRISAMIFYDAAGGPRRTIGATVDVQVLKEAAEAKARALEEAERVGRAKDEFLATMSHELRTPLNAMLGWSRILKTDHHNEAKLAKGLAVIERNAVAQTRLISDLLDVSRIIVGKLRLSRQRVAVSAILLATLDVVRPAAEAKRIELVAKVSDQVGEIVADPDRLQQVIWNLLTNAVRFTPTEGSITLSAERIDSYVRIVVSDTGEGIPGDHLSHIFERFRQVDATTTRAHGGLGLGLAIVRHLVEAHGGSVFAQSDGPGRGARFTVDLPIRAVLPEAEPERITPGTAADAARAAVEGLHGVRVLVVDDDQDSLDLVRDVLETAGAVIVGAGNAAMALAADGPFDIVVSDIGMPEMDGYTFMQRFRSRAWSANIPAIALTAYARAEDAERAVRSGYQQHLTKPIDGPTLAGAVKRWSRGAGSKLAPGTQS